MPSDISGEAWRRTRLLTVVSAVAAVCVALVVGLGFAVYYAFSSSSSAHSADARPKPVPSPHPTSALGSAHRNKVAAAPMLAVDQSAADPGTPAAVPAPAITIPAGPRTGPAGINTGFPHTPQGAVGQLAAIETAVLQNMNIATTNQIYDAWALPGGVGVAKWPLMQNVQAFLGSAQMGSQIDPTSAVVATPQGAQIKGTDGPDWTVACVLMQVRASISKDAQIGYGYCERMQWSPSNGRWMIAPGTPAAQAPSTWPGTEVSKKAGWLTWSGAGADN